MPNDDSAIKALLVLLGGLFLAQALATADKGAWKRGVFLGSFGLFLFFSGFFWTKLGPVVGPKLSSSAAAVASDFRVWLAIVLVVWLYFAISFQLAWVQRNRFAQVIEGDLSLFRDALQRFVLPRHLTPEQIKTIAEYLSKSPPFPVKLQVQKDDEEAMDFHADIRAALKGGGWVVSGPTHEPALQAGLGMFLSYTEETHRISDDPRRFTPGRVLREAFAQAGIPFEILGEQSGDTITQDEVTVRIGRRRRDKRGAKSQSWL